MGPQHAPGARAVRPAEAWLLAIAADALLARQVGSSRLPRTVSDLIHALTERVRLKSDPLRIWVTYRAPLGVLASPEGVAHRIESLTEAGRDVTGTILRQVGRELQVEDDDIRRKERRTGFPGFLLRLLESVESGAVSPEEATARMRAEVGRHGCDFSEVPTLEEELRMTFQGRWPRLVEVKTTPRKTSDLRVATVPFPSEASFHRRVIDGPVERVLKDDQGRTQVDQLEGPQQRLSA